MPIKYALTLGVLFPGLLILLVALVLTTIGGLQALNRTIRDENDDFARSMAQDIDGRLSQAQHAIWELERATIESEGKLSYRQISYMLKTGVAVDPILEAFYVTDSRRHVIYAGLPDNSRISMEAIRGWDLAHLDILTKAQDIRGFQWSPPLTSMVTGKPTVLVARGTSNGFIIGEIDPAFLNTIVDAHVIHGVRSISIMDGNGTVLAHDDSEVAKQQLNLGSLRPVSLGVKGIYGNYNYEFNGVKYLCRTFPIGKGPSFVVVARNLATLQEQGRRLIHLILTATIFLLGALSVATPWALKRIMMPISFLGENARRLNRGESTTGPAGSGIIEFDELTDLFQEMADAVRLREEDLRAGEAKFRALFECSNDGIMLMGAKGSFIDCNAQAQRHLGVTRDFLLAQGYSLISRYAGNAGEEYGLITDTLLRNANSDGLQYREIPLVRGDGVRLNVEITINPIAMGEEHLYQVVLRDTTRSRQLEKQREAAEAANRTKTSFLANISHEIKTPINAIMGYSQLLLQDKALKPIQSFYAKAIIGSGDHLLSLITEILEMSMIEAGRTTLHPSQFSLSDVTNEVLTMFNWKAMEKCLAISAGPMDGLPYAIKGDKAKVRQILINLVSNAVKFTEEGSILIDVTGQRSGSSHKISIEVTDTGVGVGEGDGERIFERFERGTDFKMIKHPVPEGSGLGLAISREYARLMGGDLVLVGSAQGVGSTFRFTFIAEAVYGPVGEDDPYLSVHEARTENILGSGCLEELPGDKRKELIRAVGIGDFNRIKAILETLRASHPLAVEALRPLVSAYDGAALMALLVPKETKA